MKKLTAAASVLALAMSFVSGGASTPPVVQADAGLGDEVDSIVGDMEALRQAVEETRSAGTPQLPPPTPGTAT